MCQIFEDVVAYLETPETQGLELVTSPLICGRGHKDPYQLHHEGKMRAVVLKTGTVGIHSAAHHTATCPPGIQFNPYQSSNRNTWVCPDSQNLLEDRTVCMREKKKISD